MVKKQHLKQQKKVIFRDKDVIRLYEYLGAPIDAMDYSLKVHDLKQKLKGTHIRSKKKTYNQELKKLKKSKKLADLIFNASQKVGVNPLITGHIFEVESNWKNRKSGIDRITLRKRGSLFRKKKDIHYPTSWGYGQLNLPRRVKEIRKSAKILNERFPKHVESSLNRIEGWNEGYKQGRSLVTFNRVKKESQNKSKHYQQALDWGFKARKNIQKRQNKWKKTEKLHPFVKSPEYKKLLVSNYSRKEPLKPNSLKPHWFSQKRHPSLIEDIQTVGKHLTNNDLLSATATALFAKKCWEKSGEKDNFTSDHWIKFNKLYQGKGSIKRTKDLHRRYDSAKRIFNLQPWPKKNGKRVDTLQFFPNHNK